MSNQKQPKPVETFWLLATYCAARGANPYWIQRMQCERTSPLLTSLTFEGLLRYAASGKTFLHSISDFSAILQILRHVCLNLSTGFGHCTNCPYTLLCYFKWQAVLPARACSVTYVVEARKTAPIFTPEGLAYMSIYLSRSPGKCFLICSAIVLL